MNAMKATTSATWTMTVKTAYGCCGRALEHPSTGYVGSG